MTEHDSGFHKTKQLATEITQNKHIDPNLDTRVVCDASTYGLCAALEQNTKEGWVAIAYASRFLNSLEEKYSVNEGVMWAIEHFKYYLYGKNITVITNHQALMSALNASERSMTSQSRLTRWIDRLIPLTSISNIWQGAKWEKLTIYPEIRLELQYPPTRTMRNLLSINSFVNNLEMIDNLILNQLAKKKLAPYRLIKKRAESKGTVLSQPIFQPNSD